MKSFSELRDSHLTEDYLQLDEKLVIVGKGKKYNQVVFLAGGAGSGKGFTIQNFMEGNKYKIRDVDEWKRLVMKVRGLKDENDEIANLDLRNPDDVAKLHQVVDDMGIKDKSFSALLRGMSSDTRPNILFDVTLKNLGNLTKVLPSLLEAGYQPENIHLIWVLTDYSVSVKQNKNRARIVPDDILLQTHEGAANTMVKIIEGGLPSGMDGACHVVLGGKEHTVVYTDNNGKPLTDRKGGVIVKDFTYFTMKKEGKPMLSNISKGKGGTISGDLIKKKLYDVIMKKIPKGQTLAKLMDK
jgi:hypothetical protein